MKMGFGLVFLLVLSLGVFDVCEGKGKGYEEAVNCKRLECAPYEVVHSQKDYEIRSYTTSMWISTPPLNSSSYKDAVGRGFNILFAYIQGNNNQRAKIDMTAPVLVDIFPSTGPSCNSSFIMYFYVPTKYQNNPPLSAQAHQVKLPKHKYAAVRRFGGFMDDSNIPTQALALRRSLKGTPWETSISTKNRALTYSVAGYNSPFEYENRVNEVIFWFDRP
ncbi:hypothetical protein PVL29_001467 [Vitis rotundifolia]|uniref:Heme-binding protein 2 n=1 Tax=Vitis rotundifolia TaxID=103349 RepID=A0AA39AN85_VITRO|nr:hypothetical protein PVL29_001467 [Vitis rotundifolia]